MGISRNLSDIYLIGSRASPTPAIKQLKVAKEAVDRLREVSWLTPTAPVMNEEKTRYIKGKYT